MKTKMIIKRENHGLYRHPLYRVWAAMLARCRNKNDKYYKNYGGRGIMVCKRWLYAQRFIKWCLKNGWKRGLEIDRENNNKGYSPSNCRIVTRKINSNNKRSNVFITYNGERKNIQQWADYLKIKRVTLQMRLLLGWSMERCVNTVVEPKEKLSPTQVIKIFNSTQSQREIARQYNITQAAVNFIKTGKNWSRVTGHRYKKAS